MRALPLLVFCACPLLMSSAGSAGAFQAFTDEPGDLPAYSETACGRLTEHPCLAARHVPVEVIQLDGRLDESVWNDAEAGWGFTQWEPERGDTPTHDTVFKILYDDDALYFGVACFEDDPDAVSSCLSRRDRIQASDQISIYLDPYFDRTSGYNFRVNPHGVEGDASLSNQWHRDPDWNAVWECGTYRDERGWYAELRIPFSSIRYRGDSSMTWGLQVYRSMHARGEDTSWATWDRDLSGFISRFGTLTGLDGVKPPRQLEILPYTVSRATDLPAYRDDDWDGYGNFGADIKYGVTSDLTLNAAIQPDFGQVESDPALLNLSPFETFYDEKRPFFIEGASFFQHPGFNLLYTRRIGTESESSRIRFAGKLTGKTRGGVSVAGLLASTDIAGEGQAHNPFLSGDEGKLYAVGRFGKEFHGGDHSINVMQTAVLRDGERFDADDPLRDGYSTGLDFDLNFMDRTYNVQGSLVGTVVDPKPVAGDDAVAHDAVWGNGGALDLQKVAGTWRYGLSGSWESDKLDPNDIGILFEPDEISASSWFSFQYNSDGEDGLINQGNQTINLYRGWLYAPCEVGDDDMPGETLWSYGAGFPVNVSLNTNAWWQLRNFWSLWYGGWYHFEGSSRSSTRSYNGQRGPLMTSPIRYGFYAGVNSDWRKRFNGELNTSFSWNGEGGRAVDLSGSARWIQNSRLNHSLSLGVSQMLGLDQWVGNFATDGSDGPIGGIGIGGVSYVFGEMTQYTVNLTLRSNILFSPDQSLELYFQPYLSVGEYVNARELVTPDTYEMESYEAADYEVGDSDFEFSAVNLNLVYRWEYRPGSTFYLVWTHGRSNFDRRGWSGEDFGGDFALGTPFQQAPTNTILAKINYWFAL